MFESSSRLIALMTYNCLYMSATNSDEVAKNSTVKSVLMMCAGNYGRSPMAESIFNHLAAKKGVASQWYCDSAGLDARVGEPMYYNAKKTLEAHNISVGDHRGRQVLEEDFSKFDYILGMDLSLIHISEPTRPY